MPDITTDLVRHYKFDDGSGTSAVDSASASTGTVRGGASWGTGQIDGAIVLDGSNDDVLFTAPNLANSSFTIAGRFVRDTSSGDMMFVAIGSNAAPNEAMHLRLGNAGNLFFGEYFNDLSSDAGKYERDTWHHAAFVYDYAAGARYIYLDGAEIASEASGVAAFAGDTVGSMGSWQALGNSEYLQGKLDDVRIYTRALSAEDVVALTATNQVNGTASFTEANETLSADASHPVTGSAIFNEVNETVSSAASHPVLADGAFTEPNETISATASTATVGTASFTEENETLSAAASHPVLAVALQFDEPGETLTSAAGPVAGATAAFTEPNETLSGAGLVVVIGNADFTEPGEQVNSLVETGVGFARRFGGRIGLGIRVGV